MVGVFQECRHGLAERFTFVDVSSTLFCFLVSPVFHKLSGASFRRKAALSGSLRCAGLILAHRPWRFADVSADDGPDLEYLKDQLEKER